MPRLLVDTGALRHSRNFRLLYIGQFFSLLGSNLTMVAIPYQVYRQTHSSLLVGLVSLFQLPFLISGALSGGAYGDRFDKRTLFMWSTLVLGVVSVGLVWNAHHYHLVLLLTLAAANAGVGGFAGPLRSAAIPFYVSADDLPGAYALNTISINLATIVGPAIAGVLIAASSLATCYAIDAVTFGLLAVMTLFMTGVPPVAGVEAKKLFRAIGDGFRYVRQNKIIQAIYLVDLNANVFGLPRALFPAVALTLYHGGPRTLGLLYAAPGVGAVLMGLTTGWLGHQRHKGRIIGYAVVGWGAAMAIFGVVHVLWIGLVALAIAGAMDVISTVLRNVLLQKAMSDDFRGRITSIQMAVVTGGPRLGDAEAGAVAALTSTEFSIVSGGLACIAGVFFLMKWRPQFWHHHDA